VHGSHRNPEVLRDRWTNIAETRGSSYSPLYSLVVQRSSLTFSHMLGNHCFRFSLKPAQFPDGMHNHKQIHYVSCTRPLEYDELLLLMIDTGFRRNPDSRWSVSLAGLR